MENSTVSFLQLCRLAWKLTGGYVNRIETQIGTVFLSMWSPYQTCHMHYYLHLSKQTNNFIEEKSGNTVGFESEYWLEIKQNKGSV